MYAFYISALVSVRTILYCTVLYRHSSRYPVPVVLDAANHMVPVTTSQAGVVDLISFHSD